MLEMGERDICNKNKVPILEVWKDKMVEILAHEDVESKIFGFCGLRFPIMYIVFLFFFFH